jgi:hypothetical protein
MAVFYIKRGGLFVYSAVFDVDINNTQFLGRKYYVTSVIFINF